jgi:hypothetical protein
MTTQESFTTDLIQEILDKVNSKELEQFPSVKNRLMQIVSKLQNNQILSERDFITLKLNNIR